MGGDKYCLRWNDYETNMSHALSDIRDAEAFFDVTLVCEDEQQMQAHKLILSACSPFFQNILQRNPHHHPLLYLKGVSHADLQSVLNFMYRGEVSVGQDELNSFLTVAEELKIKGLTHNNGASSPLKTPRAGGNDVHSLFSSQNYIKPRSNSFSADGSPPAKKSRTTAGQNCDKNLDSGDALLPAAAVKAEPRDSSGVVQTVDFPGGGEDEDVTDDVVEFEEGGAGFVQQYGEFGDAAGLESAAGVVPPRTPSSQKRKKDKAGSKMTGIDPLHPTGTNNENKDLLNLLVEEHMYKDPGGKYQCMLCSRSVRDKCDGRRHLEAKHFPNLSDYPCNKCHKSFRSLNALKSHRHQKHSAAREKMMSELLIPLEPGIPLEEGVPIDQKPPVLLDDSSSTYLDKVAKTEMD